MAFVEYDNPKSLDRGQHYLDFDMAVGSPTNTVKGDPKFTNPTTGMLTLQPDSPAIGVGTTVTNFYGPNLNLGVQ